MFENQTSNDNVQQPDATGDFIDYNIHIQDNIFTPIEKYSIMLEEVFHSNNISREARRAIRHVTNLMLGDENLRKLQLLFFYICVHIYLIPFLNKIRPWL